MTRVAHIPQVTEYTVTLWLTHKLFRLHSLEMDGASLMTTKRCVIWKRLRRDLSTGALCRQRNVSSLGESRI